MLKAGRQPPEVLLLMHHGDDLAADCREVGLYVPGCVKYIIKDLVRRYGSFGEKPANPSQPHIMVAARVLVRAVWKGSSGLPAAKWCDLSKGH